MIGTLRTVAGNIPAYMWRMIKKHMYEISQLIDRTYDCLNLWISSLEKLYSKILRRKNVLADLPVSHRTPRKRLGKDSVNRQIALLTTTSS